MVRLLREEILAEIEDACSFNPTMVRLLLKFTCTKQMLRRVSIPQWCDCYQGKIWGFGGRMRRNEGRLAVDLRLPEKPKGVDGK